MIDINPIILDHIFKHLPLLLNRDFLLDILTEAEKSKATLKENNTAIVQNECYIYTGKFLDIEGQLYTVIDFNGVSNSTGQEPFKVKALNIPTSTILTERDSPISLPSGILANYTGDTPLQTTMGRLLLNYVILVDPFGSLVPYINELWNIEKIESTYIFEALRTETITVEQVKHYSRNLHWLGHFTELAVPSFSERSLTVDPVIIKRRDELLKQYAKEIAAGDVVVMSKIVDELVAMDKASLKGDSSTPFYDYSEGKSYGIHRRTMLLLGGIVDKFGGDGYDFIQTSLEEGWQVKDFPALCNQIRSGSYSRAKETAKGGEETKFLIRVFQSTQVTEEDCNSHNTLQVKITRGNFNNYIYRNVIVNDEVVTLTDDNISQYIGITVHMRSPMYCHTKDGYCYTCMGELFRTINIDLLTMAAINVGKVFTISALKKIHGNSAKKIEIKYLNAYSV